LKLPGALRTPAGPFTIRVLGWLHLSAAEHTRTLVSLATSRTSTNAVHPRCGHDRGPDGQEPPGRPAGADRDRTDHRPGKLLLKALYADHPGQRLAARRARALSANCPRAAAVMFHAMLAALVRDQGSRAAQQAGGLHKQLKKMADEQTLHPSLVDSAAEIRLVGGAGAHSEALDPATPAEAQDLAKLCRQLLTVVYEMPARIRRARQVHSGRRLGLALPYQRVASRP
jgi:hypothetical protein